ncbi:MAG: hypothetical protein EAZ11_12730 [Curvibacter sp.]|nr:MAG: hypothetical protein EAZ11_12730 [Curvibacter sp.]
MWHNPVFSIFSSASVHAIVIRRYMEFVLKSAAFALAALALLGGLAHGQVVLQPVSYSLAPATALGGGDRAMLLKADGQRKNLETSLKDYLVAFDAQHDGSRKKVGLSITSFSGSPLELAYEPGAKIMMAQVRFGQTVNAGLRFEYRAFVAESGAMNFQISSRF